MDIRFEKNEMKNVNHNRPWFFYERYTIFREEFKNKKMASGTFIMF